MSIIKYIKEIGALTDRFQSTNGVTFDWVCTKDKIKRKCSLKVITRPLALEGIVKHVALYFDWKDKQAIYEAGELNNLLIPSWSPERITECDFDWTVEETYDFQCSPQMVNRTAADLDRTGKPYNLSKNNCYWWAYDCAKELGVEIEYSSWAILAKDIVVSAVLDVTQAFLSSDK